MEAIGNESEGNPLAMSGANQKKPLPLGDEGGLELKTRRSMRVWEG